MKTRFSIFLDRTVCIGTRIPYVLLLVVLLAFLILPAQGLISRVAAQSQQYVFVHTWGNPGSADGELGYPVDTFVDKSGRVMVVDYYPNNRVQAFSSDGIYITRTPQAIGFTSPEKIAQDSTGNYYVADTDNGRIVKLSSSLDFVIAWGGFWPRGVGVSPDDSIFVADSNGARVLKFSPAGQAITSWGNNGSVYIGGLLEAVRTDSLGNLYVISSDTVVKLDPNGNRLTSWGAFNWAQDVFVDQSNSVFVADTRNNLIRKFTSDGQPVTTFGSDLLLTPHGVSVDSQGNVYVADAGHSHVAVYAPSVATHTISGRVTDDTTVQIIGATVSASNGASTTTDINGYYTLTNLPAGSISITVSKSGFVFEPAWWDVTVPDATRKDFRGMALQCGNSVVPLRQFSDPWGPKLLDSSSVTIKQKGCLLTDWAMLLNYWGAKTNFFTTNPEQLNNGFVASHVYSPSGDIRYGGPERYARTVAGLSMYFKGWVQRKGSATDTALDNYLCGGSPIILEVPGHFVLAVGKINDAGTDTYAIIDPYNNTSSLKYYGSTGKAYLSMETYSASAPFNLRGLQIAGHSPIELMITDPLGRKTGYDWATGTVLNQIPSAAYLKQTLGDDTNPGSTPSETIAFYTSDVLDGAYRVEVVGTGNGSYTIDSVGYNDAGAANSIIGSGQIRTGQVITNSIIYSSTRGILSLSYLPKISK